MPLTVDDLGPSEDIGEDWAPPRVDTPDDERLKFRFIDSDMAQFMRRPKTAIAREYEGKAAAILGLLTRNSIGDPDTIADAATYLAYGDKLSAAAGEIADESEIARKIFDAIASPASPYLAFTLTAIPMIAQLIRNHEKETVKPVRVVGANIKVPFRKKPISIRIPLRPGLPKRFRAQTVDPKKCAELVFSNPDVAKALRRRGINVAWPL